MSAANVPESLKSIAPYLQRASQLQEREPIISYYSNYYAAKIAIPKAGQDNNRAFVMELLDTLEKQRKEIGDNEAISNDLVGYAYIENFALKIFGKADDEDRAGQGSQKTAKNFVAAANFLELLKVFGEVDTEVEKKIKYSKWRAAEIVKAIRDGRQPVPPPGTDKPKEASPDVKTGIEGFESLNVGSNTVDNFFGDSNSNTAYTPANIPPIVPAVTQPGFGAGSAASFPTITNFPDPPLGSSNQNNIHGDLNNSNINSNWSQPPISPNLNMNQNQNQNQGQNFYNPPGSLQPQQPQQPPSTYIPPAVSPSVMPNSGYMPTVSNPTSPPPSNAQFGYGNNSVNNNNFYQQPTAPSSAPAPAPAPAPVPTQNPYTQPGFGTPSTPYQQPHQVPSPQVPYATAPMVLDPAINAQVQKHCKWTVSALTYDDIPTAIDNLEKALALLRPYNNKQ